MSKTKKYKTDFLTPNHNFLTGLGSIFSIQGNYYEFNYSKTDTDADWRAIENDWGMIGDDIRKSLLDTSKKEIPALV